MYITWYVSVCVFLYGCIEVSVCCTIKQSIKPICFCESNSIGMFDLDAPYSGMAGDEERRIAGKRIFSATSSSVSFFIPFIILALRYSCAPSKHKTQIRRHIADPPPPAPLRLVPSLLSREEMRVFFPPRVDLCLYSSNIHIYIWYVETLC